MTDETSPETEHAAEAFRAAQTETQRARHELAEATAAVDAIGRDKLAASHDARRREVDARDALDDAELAETLAEALLRHEVDRLGD